MSNIKDYIDNRITSRVYSTSQKNIYGRIDSRIKVFIEAKEKGTLNSSAYKGIDKLIAERVDSLCGNNGTISSTQTVSSIATEIKKKKVLTQFDEGYGQTDGYVTWAGNESYVCPWLRDFITASTGGDQTSANPFTPSQSSKYRKFCNGITFNTTSILTDQNRQIAISSTQVAKISKSAKKLTIALYVDKESLEGDGATGTAIKSINLSTVLPEDDLWCFGKILHNADYIYIGVFKFADIRSKNHFEQPRHYSNNDDDAMGYTIDSYIVAVGITNGVVTKLNVTHSGSVQTKLRVIRGYTDFIVHQNKIFAVRSKPNVTVSTFTGKKLIKRSGSNELVSGGILKHNIDSYTFEIVELKINISDPTIIDSILVTEVIPPPPESDGKFGFKGSKIGYTTAKLAASDLVPYTFFVQQYYELVLQLPYSYAERFTSTLFVETAMGKKLRTDSDFYSKFLAGDLSEQAYGSSRLIASIPGIKFGGITKVVGHLYLQAPMSYNSDTGIYSSIAKDSSYLDLIYETVGESQPTFSPETSSWVLWNPPSVPNDYYSWDWKRKHVNALDLWVVYHLVSRQLSTGVSGTPGVCQALNLGLRTDIHPIALDVANRVKQHQTIPSWVKSIAYWESKNVRWMNTLDKKIGNFPFPYEKWFSYQGGQRGTKSWAVSGYNGWMETFLVSYAGDKYPLNGSIAADTARPVLIIAGIGPYASKWGATGWDGQMTQSPLVVEVFSHEARENITVDYAVNDSSCPKVTMQANHTVLGTIGYYYPGFDISLGLISEYGMYPMAQNGFYINEAQEMIQADAIAFGDMRLSRTNPKQIYYSLFVYSTEYNTKTRAYILNNYYLENRAYEIGKPGSGYQGNSMMAFSAAKAMAYWWSKQTPGRSIDPVPWFGPCQLDMHIKL